ncbi:MAG: response regulator [Bacillota bacterium]
MAKRTVLFVDDELNILSSLRRGLVDVEYNCLFANSAEEALEIMSGKEVSVIVADMKMPVMDGLKLLKIVKEKYPDTVRVVLSGYTQIPQMLATINQGDIFRFIAKPWRLEEDLKVMINEALEYYDSIKEKQELKAALEKRNIMYQNILKTTDEKLNYYREEHEKLKSINKCMLKLFEKNCALQDCDSNISYFDTIITCYIDSIAYSNSTYDMARFKYDVFALIEEFENSGLIVNVLSEYTSSFYCNSKLLLFIFEFVIRYLRNLYEKNQIKVSIATRAAEDAVNLILVYEIIDGINTLNNEELLQKPVFILLNEICRGMNGHTDTKLLKENINVIISFKFNIAK